MYDAHISIFLIEKVAENTFILSTFKKNNLNT